MKILGISGSSRVKSFNRMALHVVADSLGEEIEFEIIDWEKIPAFDAERLGANTPIEVLRLSQKIKVADGLVISSPEYNYSVPGMLKNLIDWLSKVDGKPLKSKHVAILSVTTGQLGGARVQYELRKIMLCVDAIVLTKPEVFVSKAKEKFNAEGACIDSDLGQLISTQMKEFVKSIQGVDCNLS